MEILLDLEILFGLAIVTVILFRRLLFPSIVGFFIAGIVAGPAGLGLIRSTHHIEQVAEIGVVLLLFTLGIEFSLKELMRIKHLVFLGGGIQVLVTILTVAGCSLLLAVPWNRAIFLGFLVALSSTAILMKLLMDGGQLDAPHGKAALGILIFQDLCVVPLMLFTPFLAGGNRDLAAIALVLGKAAVVVAGAHLVARFLVPWIFRQVVRSRSRELFILTVLFVGLGTAWLTAQAGLSLALGAFIAGLAISESEYSQQVLGDIIPFRDAFLSLFFISVGMLLDPAVLLRAPLLLAGAVLLIIALKALVAGGAGLAIGLPLRIAVITGLILAQVGEFSFVLARAGLTSGLLDRELYQLFLAATVATMALSPLLLRLAPPLAEAAAGVLPRTLVRGRGILGRTQHRRHLTDHVIIVGYGLNGRNLATALKQLEIPYLVAETNPFNVETERKRGEQIVFGDASRPEVLEHLHVGQARILVVAISDAAASRRIVAQARQLNPLLHIIVRTRYVAEVEPLLKLGATEVIPEEFETSVEILSRTLKKFLLPHEVIEERIAEVRQDGYGMLRGISRRHSHAVGIAGYLSGAEIATFEVRQGAELEGTSLREGVLRSRSGASVIAIKRGAEVVPNPDPVWKLCRGDVVLLLGTPQQLAAAGRLFVSPAAGTPKP